MALLTGTCVSTVHWKEHSTEVASTVKHRLSLQRLILFPAVALLGLAASLIAPFVGDAVRAVQAAGACVEAGPALDAEESALLALINRYRSDHGAAPLKLSPSLVRSARWMARDMGERGYFGHTDSLRRGTSDRAHDCGYRGLAGENITAGTERDTAEEAFESWKRSPSHDRNMLDPDYRAIGIGRAQVPGSTYNWYWVTDLGLDDDGGVAPMEAPQAAPRLALHTGANLVTWPGNTPETPSALIAATDAAVMAVYSFDAATGTWLVYGPSLPVYVNSLRTLQPGSPYWVFTDAND